MLQFTVTFSILTHGWARFQVLYMAPLISSVFLEILQTKCFAVTIHRALRPKRNFYRNYRRV